MPSTGDGTAWSLIVPSDSDNVTDGALEIREVKYAVSLRSNKEHVAFGDSSAGGEHKPGSAKAFYQVEFPIKRPDGLSDLTSDDGGRLFIKSDTGGWYYYHAVDAKFKPLVLTNADNIADAVVKVNHIAAGEGENIIATAVIVEQQTNTIAGGTFSSGAWRTRGLNTITTDEKGIVKSLTTNQFTLSEGTYIVRVSAPAVLVDAHQCRLRDITNNVTRGYGTTEFSPSALAYGVTTRSVLTTRFSISSDTVYELQHICGTTKTGNGFGSPGSFGVTEIYATVEIQKLK